MVANSVSNLTVMSVLCSTLIGSEDRVSKYQTFNVHVSTVITVIGNVLEK